MRDFFSALAPTRRAAVTRGLGVAAVGTVLAVAGCTQETQNQLGRAVRNWTVHFCCWFVFPPLLHRWACLKRTLP